MKKHVFILFGSMVMYQDVVTGVGYSTLGGSSSSMVGGQQLQNMCNMSVSSSIPLYVLPNSNQQSWKALQEQRIGQTTLGDIMDICDEPDQICRERAEEEQKKAALRRKNIERTLDNIGSSYSSELLLEESIKTLEGLHNEAAQMVPDQLKKAYESLLESAVRYDFDHTNRPKYYPIVERYTSIGGEHVREMIDECIKRLIKQYSYRVDYKGDNFASVVPFFVLLKNTDKAYFEQKVAELFENSFAKLYHCALQHPEEMVALAGSALSADRIIHAALDYVSFRGW